MNVAIMASVMRFDFGAGSATRPLTFAMQLANAGAVLGISNYFHDIVGSFFGYEHRVLLVS